VGSTHPAADSAAYNGCVYLDYNATTPIFPEVGVVGGGGEGGGGGGVVVVVGGVVGVVVV
jgi:hypothetical protein